MPEGFHLPREADRTLTRILPSVKRKFGRQIRKDRQGWGLYQARLIRKFHHLFTLYFELYSGRYDFFFHMEELLMGMTRAWFSRSDELRELDQQRELEPRWFQSNQILGAVCYVDLFAGTLEGIRSKIPYFQELGLTYLHLMPLFDSPKGENDGGYAVSSYRKVNPALGSMKELTSLAEDLRRAGIGLALDLVFNHTSDEHIWAKRARAGDPEYQEFYRIYPDRSLPDAYERHLREIFPDEHPGAFTFDSTLNQWIWTTFHKYQWDLNYENPTVFNRMAEEMLFLANQGVEILRLDAVAFIWKELGTSCENLPQAHTLIQAFNAIASIVAPGMVFKSEAIVHPDDVVKYISPHECQLSYNPLFMALLWNSLATRKTRLLSQALATRFEIHPDTAWINYVRVHDDIGWTFSDEDAAVLGINAQDHRQFLNEFYRGRYPGSFARGLPFQENPYTGDCRISGTCASLAGLEKALTEDGREKVEFAIRRIVLLYGMVMTSGGIPLIYLGDEIGTLNDYTYSENPANKNDSRWVHRPQTNWSRMEKRRDPSTIEGRVFERMLALIKIRRSNEAFSAGQIEVLPTGNDHIIGFKRSSGGQRASVWANFSESAQSIPLEILEGYQLISGNKIHGSSTYPPEGQLVIEPLDFLVIVH